MKNFIIIILGFVVFASCGKSNKDKSFLFVTEMDRKRIEFAR